MLRRRALLSLAMSLPSVALAQAGPQGAEGAELREQVWRIPVPLRRGSDGVALLEATLFRPLGPGPFPVAIVNHGQPAGEAARRAYERPRYPNAARFFTGQGFAVLLPLRRGFGASEGEFLGGTGGCDRLDLDNNANTAANDIESVMRWLPANMPFLNAQKILLVGQSAGGFGVLAVAARRTPGLSGVVNFSGGIRASSGAGINSTHCEGGPDALVARMRRLGERTGATTPTLWLYAHNDSFFGYGLSTRMVTAWREAGGMARYQELPVGGRDGHGFFPSDQSVHVWQGPVAAFLTELRAAGRL